MPTAPLTTTRLRGAAGWRAGCWASAALLLAACSALQPPALQPGQTEAEVLAAMGQPTGRYPLAGGAQRLEYARGPAGRTTWMVDLDTSGRVQSAVQVLDAAHFALVQGGMPGDALLRLLGRPANRQGEWQGRQTWSWRYQTNDCLWFRVTLTAAGQVQDGGAYMTDPACDARTGNEPR